MEDRLVIGPYVLDRAGRRLLRGGVAIPLGARALDTLAALASAQGEVVGKNALLDAVWPGMVVEENNLQVQISALRKLLGEGWIVNVPGRGYRLSAPVADTASPPPLPDKPSLVVLPFQNLSGDPEQGYFADGMVEDLTAALSRIGALFVIARNSAFTYQGRAVDVREIGRELGVRYVVEGSVRKAGGQVRVTCQLIEAASGAHLWAERFEGPLDDIFALQDRITEQIAGAIEPTLNRAEIQRALAKPAESLTAHDLYYRALHLVHLGGREDLEQALALLRRGIADGPGYVRARALAARVLSRAMMATWLPRDQTHVGEAVALAKSALRDAGDDPEVLSLAGFTLLYISEDRAMGHRACERAVAINPNSSLVLLHGALSAMYANRPDDARERCRRIMRLSPLDPLTPGVLMTLALAAYDAGDPAQGLAEALQVVELDPGGHHVHGPLIYCLVALRRIAEAREVAREMAERYPGETITHNLVHLQAFTPEQRERRLHALRMAGLPE